MEKKITSIFFNKSDLVECYKFSKLIISEENQYNRFKKNIQTQIERTFVGKLGELAFLKLIRKNGIVYNDDLMFQIFEGKTNVDKFDFKTNNGKLVDIKVASKPFHKRIMVPIDQFKLKKDFYAGIKLNFKIDKKGILILNSVNRADFYGYCLRGDLEKSQTTNFGEGPCKHILLNKLENILQLISKFF